MFFEFLRFELRYWLRGWMVYIFLAILALLFFAAASSDNITVGQALGNTYRNAPYVIQMYYAMVGIFTGLMVTAFVDSAASRDFASKSSEILFSKPISKASYVFGRFTGAYLIAVIPTLGVSIGIILAKYMPWVDAERWGPIHWQAHLNGILAFALPNTLIFGAIVFALAVVTRNTLYSFIGTLLLLVGYAISSSYLSDLENETLGAMLDPLGIGAFSIATKYWAVEEKNTLSVGLTGLVLYNRLLWSAIAVGVAFVAYGLFSFSEKPRRGRQKKTEKEMPLALEKALPVCQTNVVGLRSEFAQFFSHLKNDFRGVIRSTVFLVLLAACMLNVIPSVWLNATQSYGQSSFPVTYFQIENIRGSMITFLLAIITFFGGVLIWRDRDVRMHEILGALPYPNWTAYLSRLVSLIFIIAILLSCGIAIGIGAQLASGYNRLQLDVYIKDLLVIDLVKMSFLAVLALLMHSLAPNKYIGYFLFIIFVVLNAFLWDYMRIETLLVRYGRMPTYTYSDMYGFAPYASGLFWFGLYWLLFSVLVAWFTVRVLHRGVSAPLKDRLKSGLKQVRGSSLALVGVFGLLWIGLGSWLYYNTHVLNELVSAKERESRQVDYEKAYKSLENSPSPYVTKIDYEIDIFPEERKLTMKGTQDLVNKSDGPLETVFFTLYPGFDTTIEIEGATLKESNDRLLVRTYAFDKPLMPGESTKMRFVVASKSRGIENNVTNMEVNQNGTFFNNSIAPEIGYSVGREIADPNKRRSFGLPKTDGFPALTREKGAACMRHYVAASDWVDVETVISTSSDQIAVAPGSLIEKWEKDGRRYYRYRLDHPSLNFYSFISARFEVARDKWNDVDVEVYYHPEHAWNVPKMVDSIKNSLEYCTKNFGPYRHKQARIIEFPRISSFAQAFPGTMPYSESIGFIANLEDPEDIDMVYYVVAHEMAHQWWAHQVIGAKMQGATLLSETMAQYSALMIMEHKYGRPMMQKFLKYEMNSYLRSRGSEFNNEKPLLEVNPEQGYVHYRKGSVVLYYLKEMIGEDRINMALKSIVDKYGYQEPPYPNAYDLVDALKGVMPPELHYLIKDLFEEITLFSNRTLASNYRKLPNGKYAVSVDIECEKLKSDSKGKTEKVPVQDWIEIGAFAKPEPGKKYGKELYRKREYLTEGKATFEFEVDEVPDLVGIDPYYLMIDRIPDDNLKKAVFQESTTDTTVASIGG